MLGLLLPLIVTQAPPTVGLPTDWSALAPLPYVKTPDIAPTLSHFVAGEIAAGRCVVPKPADGHYVVQVDVAALVTSDGTVRRTTPRAIDCPTVEQYSAGLVESFARANLRTGSGGDQWYRATIIFDWRE